MELWIGLTIAGAFLQNLRSLLQKRLTGELSVNAAAYVRFFYAIPFAWIYVAYIWEGRFPDLNFIFVAYVMVGAIMQIIATSALVAAVSGSHFAVGTALSKTEAVQAALLGLIILGDAVSGLALTGIAVSLVGVFFLSGSIRSQDFLQGDASVWYGVLAGTAFALCSVCFRGASLALGVDVDGSASASVQINGVPILGVAERAGFTLAVTLTLQTVLMGIYLFLREPEQMAKVLLSWPIAVWVGLIGSVSSICWFTAMTLQNAAIVRALGQVELLFTLVTSVFFLRERIRIREMVGMFLLVLGILLLV